MLHKADAALINGGSIRASIAPGPILVKHIHTALPFDSYFVAIRMGGGHIREALEHRVASGAGAFPQVSGMSSSYSMTAPPGSRVRNILMGGTPLELDREHLVATNDFLAAGGDGYTVFGDAIRTSKDYTFDGGVPKGENLVYSDSGRWIRDAVIDYLKENNRLTQVLAGRITEVR